MRSADFYSFWYLLWRSLLPSITSFITSSVLAFTIIGTHLLLLSVNAGALLPQLFNTLGGGWSATQSSQLIVPVTSAIHSNYVNTVLVIGIWGFAGWIVYEITYMTVVAVRSVRENQESVYMPRESLVVRHPLRRWFIVRLLWRAVIIIVAVIIAALLQPFMQHLWNWDVRVTQVDTLLGLLKLLGLAYAGWLVVFHIFLVLLRLFLLRTRVYGEMVH